MTINLALDISSRHSNLNFAHQFVIYWLFQNGANKNQHQDSYQRETVPDKFVFFSKLVRQKKSIGWAKYVYVCEWDMCWRNFCNFPWWLKNVKSRSKIVCFFKWAPFWNSLKQAETRTSHGPIPHPLTSCINIISTPEYNTEWLLEKQTEKQFVFDFFYDNKPTLSRSIVTYSPGIF